MNSAHAWQKEECTLTERYQLIFTCEHGGNQIPEPYSSYFAGHEEELQSHLGYDAGALELAKKLAKEFHAPFIHSTISRLLIDLNRSITHPDIFSFITRDISSAERFKILHTYYYPQRQQVESTIHKLVESQKPALHIGVHSFTPILNKSTRKADIGILYSPRRPLEKQFCHMWKSVLETMYPSWTIRRNYPYLGVADGFSSHLREIFSAKQYVGIELEINQKHVLDQSSQWKQVQKGIVESLKKTLSEF
ncbi:MAG: N-formylglutamate amidohydrolase [Candidatus Omnitrophota bacterium]|jgi:predicted N-formylglutamate amidohydrolase|nr:MAG: N-formylglutamate amidohydrolase [Candidatus Omnitrophota bacterium]